MGKSRKVGRNDFCPCGSGAKYKHCCLKSPKPFISPLAFAVADNNIQRQIEQNRKSKFGHVRPLVHADWQGEKWVGVGSELHHSSDWKTPIDFLFDYPKHALTLAWGKAELKKPLDERHLVMQWYDSLCKLQALQSPGADGIYAMTPNGAALCYLLFSYDLFTLRHHSALQQSLLRRLRHKDQFQGARHELYAIATCIRAGYSIDFEDESDRTRKHTEFMAAHRATGQKISVEAKSRHRPGVLGFPGKRVPDDEVRAGVRRLVNDALQKPATEPFVIFVDLNLPPNSPAPLTSEWFENVCDPAVLNHLQSAGGDPWNLLLFSNIPNHYVDDASPAPSGYVTGLFGKNPKLSEKYPQAVRAVFDAALKFGTLPESFEEMQ